MEIFGDDEHDAITTWLNSTTMCLMVSGPQGEVYWCNEAFERWSGYSLYELTRIGWRKISVDDDGLEADLRAVEDCLAGKRRGYTVRKKYIPKNESPQWGELSVVRFPASGEMQWFLCTWVPLVNQTSQAFHLAVEHIKQNTAAREMTNEELKALRVEIQHSNELTKPQRLMLGLVDIAWTHPKATWAAIFLLASLLISNNVLELIKKLSGLQTQFSQPAEPHSQPPATQIASIGPDTITITTPAGHIITREDMTHGLRVRAAELFSGADCFRWADGSVRSADVSDRRSFGRPVWGSASTGDLHGQSATRDRSRADRL